MTDREAMQQALEALKFGLHVGFDESSESQIKKGGKAFDQHSKAITALRERLAQTVEGGGVCRHCDGSGCVACDTRCLPEQPVQEPVASCNGMPAYERALSKIQRTQPMQDLDAPLTLNGVALYPNPPQRKPLTDEEKDAARWRFLVDNSFDKEGATQFHVWEHSWEPHSQTGEPTEWKQRVRGPALDRFIDRAIEAAHNIKGEA